MAKKITILEEACCMAYMKNGGNQSEAFRASHKSAAKWKPESIWQNASKLFARPHVKSCLNELKERAREIADEELDIDIKRVLLEYSRIAFADIRTIFSDSGSLIHPADLDDDIAGAVSSIDIVSRTEKGEGTCVDRTHKIRLANKLAALDSLARYLGLFDGPVDEGPEMTRFKDVRIPEWMSELIPNVRR